MANIYIDPYLEQSANNGNIESIRKIIDLYYKLNIGKSKAERRPNSLIIKSWYEKLVARSNDPEDWTHYANFLRVELDDVRSAALWTHKAAEAGHTKAMGSLGAYYYEGVPGVLPRDQSKADYWWTKESSGISDTYLSSPSPSYNAPQTTTNVESRPKRHAAQGRDLFALSPAFCALALYALFLANVLIPRAYWINTSFVGMLLWLSPIFPLSLVLGLCCLLIHKALEGHFLYKLLRLIYISLAPIVAAWLTIKDGAVYSLGTSIAFVLFIGFVLILSLLFSLPGWLIVAMKSSNSPGNTTRVLLLVLMVVILIGGYIGWRELVNLSAFAALDATMGIAPLL